LNSIACFAFVMCIMSANSPIAYIQIKARKYKEQFIISEGNE